LATSAAVSQGGEPTTDPIVETLARAGIRAEQLGFRPKGYWLRYPDPKLIPYKNRLFGDLFAEPGRIYPTVRLLATAARKFLRPSYSDTAADALFKLAFYTGWDLKISGFRPYNAALNARPAAREPLVEAIAELTRSTGRLFDYFSNEKPSDWPRPREEVRAAVSRLDPVLRRILAQAILDLTDAIRWHALAFRRVDRGDVLSIWNVRDLPATQPDGAEYFPQIDDIATSLDEAALVASSRKAVFAAGRLAVAVRRWMDQERVDLCRQSLDLQTPAGRVVVGSSRGERFRGGNILLLLDLGGDDVYEGPVAASASPTLPVSILVDMGGNDTYRALDPMDLAQGCGFFGTGVLVDVRGRDRYEAVRCAQGFGLFGTGLLADLEGDDTYRTGTSGQGAGILGVGLLFDRSGADAYTLDGDGQGYGGPGGVGTLVDLQGDDTYYAEPYAEKVNRPDYHSQGIINSSNAQGSGMGRRGDITDGHAWAGGMGTLLDLAGNDTYTSGNWSAGAGYWYGMGFLYDAQGDDTYRASVFSLAAGAHFCIAGLFDDGGDDRYLGLGDSHTGMGFGHDFTVAILWDREGNDVYDYGADGFAHAINMSQVFFVEGSGDDTYILGRGKRGFGVTDFSPRSLSPRLELNYHLYPTEVALFLDLAGRDTYQQRAADEGLAPADSLADGRLWVKPPDPRGEAEGRWAGIFRDMEATREPEWFRVRIP
jgi:hypothetical protein